MQASGGNYSFLIQKIDEFIRKYYLNKIVRGCIYLLACLFTAYILITVAEYYGNFSPIVRTSLFFLFLLANGFILLKWVGLPLLSYFKLGNTLTYEQASQIIGQHFYPVKDKLLNTLQLKKLASESPQQRMLIEASINQKINELSPVPFASAIRIQENKKYIRYVAVPFAVIIIIALTAPSIFSESTERLIQYNKRFIKKAPFQFHIQNDLTAIQGSDFTLEVKLSGDQIPDEIYLEDGVNTFKLEKQSTVRFSHTFRNIQESKSIRLIGGEFYSEEYAIEVKYRPTLLNFDAHLEYPAYLQKRNEVISNAGDLTVPAGTKITWKLNTQHASMLYFSVGKKFTQLAANEENQFSYNWRALESTTYSVQPGNKETAVADKSLYQLRVIPDLHPTIAVAEQSDSVNNKVLYFTGPVGDDYGFSRLIFHFRITDSNGKQRKSYAKPVSFDKNAIQSNFFHVWNIKEAEGRPGDQIEYYFEVFDNDGVRGAKSARTAIKTFNVPTQKEVEQKLEAGGQAVKQKMEQAVRKAGQIEKEAKRIGQELLDKKNLSYDEKKQVEQLLQKQKELDNLIKEIQLENKQNLVERQESIKQQEEILEKQKQIEDLFNNVLDEKTREILKNIEKLLEQNNKNLTRNELSKMQMDNKSVQKELDRILELYKQLEFDQKLSESIDKLKHLSQEQEKLSNQTLQKDANKEVLKSKQENLNNQFEEFKQDLLDLEKKNEALSDKNDFENPREEQAQIQEQQSQSSKNLQNKNMSKAAQNQKKAAQHMKELSQKLESMQQENEEQENQVNQQALREILDNLVISSFDQEKVMQSLKKLNANDPAYSQQTQKQKNIKDNLKVIEDSLFSLSKKVPQIESVVNKEIQAINQNINQALENLSERQTAEAVRNQQFAMTSINNLALMLSEVSDQLQRVMKNAKGGGKGKKQQSLSQLSKMQEQLNKNMQKAREQLQQNQGQKPGKGQMSEQMAKMAREQQLIRQALQEINRDLNKDGKGGLGKLDDAMKQMEQTETDLVNKKIRQETIIRQQDILSRLLEAEKAEREREQDNKLDSKAGSDFAPNYNIKLQEFQKLKTRETELLRTVPPSLNSFYKNKVGDYFKFLNSGK